MGKAHRRRIKKKKASKRGVAPKWNRKEEEFLIRNANKMTTEELADKLNRSYYSIVGKKNILVEYGAIEKIIKSRKSMKKPRIAPRLNMLIYYHLSHLQNKITNIKKKKSKESSKWQSLRLLRLLSSQTASVMVTPP